MGHARARGLDAALGAGLFADERLQRFEQA
jgi:hypothetical protein